MGMKLLAVTVAVVIAATISVESNIAASVSTPAPELLAERMGVLFLQYRTAVATFQRQNPGFTGSVPLQSLNALGFQFPQDFLNLVGNTITPTGINGRVVTSYGNLPAGAGTVAQKTSQGDSSLGVASGSSWTSYNGVAATLATSVPDGAVVSVIQIGN